MTLHAAIPETYAQGLLQTYFKAKDENRPYFMADAFERDAVVEMSVQTDAISFPARMEGIEAIADGLVRKFGATYENVHSFYLEKYPGEAGDAYVCDWLVAMSDKESGKVRVGCGRYDWHFVRRDRWLVDRLHISIAAMVVLPGQELDPVMGWATRLPYPWTGNERALAEMPRLAELEPVRNYLAGVRRREGTVAESAA